MNNKITKNNQITNNNINNQMINKNPKHNINKSNK